MKIVFTFFLVTCSCFAFAQQKDCSTQQFVIKGTIKKEFIVTVQSLDSFSVKDIPDVIITNHLGEKKSEAKGMKGILIRDILQQAVMEAASPKQLSEFYFVFTACDGYKVVYSWNEIFNTETGNHIFLVTQKDGKPLADIGERMLTVTPTDFKTGRRFVKGLESITVNRIQ